jgi:hypothetical protein
MKPSALLNTLLLASLTALHAAAPDLSKVTSRADLDAVIAATADAALKQALNQNAAAILAAAEQHPHVEAVIRTIETAPGTFTKINTTPEALKTAAGGDIALFDTLTLVSTGILNGRPHVYRSASEDPYDAAFIEHLGHIAALESVKIVAPKIEESWMAPLVKLPNLKSLSIEGAGRLGDASLAQLQQLTKLTGLTSLELAYFGKATDTGLEQLAGLKNLERFTFRGSPISGQAFAKFEGWTKLNYIRFHSNKLDDEGLGYVCEHFPNLETLNLIHSQALTDASAAHLLKLLKLKSLYLNGPKVTAAVLKNLSRLPLEYVMIDQGAINPATDAIANVKSIPTLRRLAIGGKPLTDADLVALAGVRQLEELSFENLDLPDTRLPQLQAFSFLKTLTLALRPKGYPAETQTKLIALLPKVEVKFVQ